MAKTGIRPSIIEAIRAKCCECLGNYGDGKYQDCEIVSCPLYIKRKFNILQPNLDWIFGKWSINIKKQKALGYTQEQFINEFYKRENKLYIRNTSIIRAKCYRCCGDFHDKRQDCNIRNCSLYYWMPYRTQLPEYDWIFDLNYTKKHSFKRRIEQLSREEYINKYIDKKNQ